MTHKQNPLFFHNSLEHLPNKHICLLQVGWEKCKPRYQYTNSRNFYLVHFIRSGKGTLSIDNQTFSLNVNDVFLIRPNQLAVYTADAESPWEYYYFAFSGQMAASLVERTYLQNGQLVHTMKDDTLYQCILDAALGMENCKIPDIYGLEHLFRFLSLLIPEPEAVATLSDLVEDSPKKYLYAVQEYVQFNYYKPIQISDICDTLNISRSYLFRIFKKYTGSSAEEYLLSFRLQQAKKLLSTTELPASTIAQLIGYVNSTSFYRMFKRMEGMSPKEWRKLHHDLTSQSTNGSIQEFSQNE